MAVALFNENGVVGEVIFSETRGGTEIRAKFTKLPPGKHGFHIHRAGDLRGEGCLGACEHYHRGPPSNHGGPPISAAISAAISEAKSAEISAEIRHTGDLGNIDISKKNYTYFLKGTHLSDLYGRSVIVHADEDDLGKGTEVDSLTTGHSGKRIGCAIIGRISCKLPPKRTTRRKSRA